MMIVRQLYDMLPEGYAAAPNVHLGRMFEIDISAFEEGEPSLEPRGARGAGPAVATATEVTPEPTLVLETDLADQDEYEVRVYDIEYGRRLVAAIEIVSPSNKDRPASRRTFAAKVAALLQQEVCVSIVDLVTVRQSNLYADVLELIGEQDPRLGPNPPSLYTVTMRARKQPPKRSLLELWFYPMNVGQTLPTLPIWLKEDLCVLLPLEPGYEETCRLLRIA
ncbi:MAG: DUF4058 family protein [Pirellulaceae bacterium]|nr:DUF4058 family protein [Pirellulaceae bacterium]